MGSRTVTAHAPADPDEAWPEADEPDVTLLEVHLDLRLVYGSTTPAEMEKTIAPTIRKLADLGLQPPRRPDEAELPLLQAWVAAVFAAGPEAAARSHRGFFCERLPALVIAQETLGRPTSMGGGSANWGPCSRPPARGGTSRYLDVGTVERSARDLHRNERRNLKTDPRMKLIL